MRMGAGPVTETHFEVWASPAGDTYVLPFLKCDKMPYPVFTEYWRANIFHNGEPVHGWGSITRSGRVWKIQWDSGSLKVKV